MKRLTRGIAVFLVVLMTTFSLFGCANDTKTDAVKADGGANGGVKSIGDPNDEYYMITFMSGLEFWKDCFRGFEDASKVYDAKVFYTGAQEFDINQQVTILEQIIAKKPAGIAITCVNAEGLKDPINKAIDEGIEVVVFDSDSPQSNRNSILQTDNAFAGEKTADLMAEAIGGSGEVAVIFTAGTPTHEARAKGYIDAIKNKFPNMTLVAQGNYDGEREDSARAAAAILQAHPNLKGIMVVNAPGGIGAATAVREAGLQDKVTVVSIDHDQALYDAIKEGSVYGTVKQGAYNMGFWSMHFLFNAKNNLMNPVEGWRENGLNPLPPYVNTGVDIITKENVDVFSAK